VQLAYKINIRRWGTAVLYQIDQHGDAAAAFASRVQSDYWLA
jgi:hypothetical protein